MENDTPADLLEVRTDVRPHPFAERAVISAVYDEDVLIAEEEGAVADAR